MEKTQGYEMDKKHKWQVCMFDDFDKLDKVPDEYEDPPPVEYKPVVRPYSSPSLALPLEPITCEASHDALCGCSCHCSLS